MSRSGYNDDCDYAELNLYRANVDRAIAGKRGQALLRDLISALDAMPEKKLVYGSFVAKGGVCALGAVAQLRGLTEKVAEITPEEGCDEDIDIDTRYVAKIFNVADCLAREVMYENDEGTYVHETEEQRWARVRRWAERNIRSEPAFTSAE